MNLIRNFGRGLHSWPLLGRKEQEVVHSFVHEDCLKITLNVHDYEGGLYSTGIMRIVGIRKEVEFSKALGDTSGFVWRPLENHAWSD